jgi:hypothetical protein
MKEWLPPSQYHCLLDHRLSALAPQDNLCRLGFFLHPNDALEGLTHQETSSKSCFAALDQDDGPYHAAKNQARRSPKCTVPPPFGWRIVVVPLVQHRANTVAAPERRQSCRHVAGMLQACCRLVGGFLVLSPARPLGRGLVGSSLRSVAFRRSRL